MQRTFYEPLRDCLTSDSGERRPIATWNGDRPEPIHPWYCYCVQAWIENGKVSTCGHRSGFTPPCYACEHANERHTCEHCKPTTAER